MATKKSTSTAVTKWDEELAKQAAIASGMEDSTATGQFFGLRAGQLTFNDSPIQNNEMGVIILDSILENVYYEGEFDSENPTAPTCFAYGRDAATMEPHKLVKDAGQQINDVCAGCPMNEFGSAEKGRGKACRNTRRLAMIPAGTFDNTGKFTPYPNNDHYETAQIAYMKLPVTSVKGYAGFVKQVAGALRRPPHAIYTKVKVVPDAKSQFKVIFEPLSQVPDKLLSIIMARHSEAMELIEFPYQLDDPESHAAAKKGKTSKVKPGVKARPAVRKSGRY